MVISAALLHASWNVLLKSSDDRLAGAFFQVASGAAALFPLLLVDGLPLERWPSLLVSGSLHLGYAMTLVRAYERGDLSVVYPLARGTAPLLAAAGAAVLLDDVPTLVASAGICLIVGGIVSVTRGRPAGYGWALLCGLFIAGYTIVDSAAVRAEGDSLRYTAALFALNALVLGVVTFASRSVASLRQTARFDGGRHALGGLASAGAYLLVLTAVRTAPLGAVAALRETSVVFAALAGWALLGEPLGRVRVAAALAIATGAALLAV